MASSIKPKVNLRSTAVKRIMQEASELAAGQDDDFTAAPLENDIFEWHCTMRGVEGTEYEGGLYHLRIVLPPSYPMSAPDIILMTPNGRFELGKKICIDGLTSFHAGSWQPAWGVRTAILGLRSFWMQGGEALSAIGALNYSKDERKRLAKLSREWSCPTCGVQNCQQLFEKVGREPYDEATTPTGTATDDNPPFPVVASEPELVQPSLTPFPLPSHSATTTRPVTTTTLSTPKRSSPLWLDLMIGLGVSLLAVLIGRRLL
ncbi:ubiquitin-conjugating enzyme E2 J1, partial [Tremellales sp. Uapishka_1]